MDVSRANTMDSAEFTTQKAVSVENNNNMATEKKVIAAEKEKKGTDSSQKYEDEIVTGDSKMTSEFLQKIIDKANKQLFGSDREICYSVHKKTGDYLIKIIDRETKDVLREIPPEKTLDAVAKMWELAGVLVDEKK